MIIEKPLTTEYDPFYAGYIQSVDDQDVIGMIKDQQNSFPKFINDIPQEKHDYAYAEGKWSIRQVVRHLIDAERMFGYRAMAIARGDQTKLPGFDDHLYVQNADDSGISMQALLDEFISMREGHIRMIANFPISALMQMGNANGSDISVRAIIFIIAGHLAHHKQIIIQRYLSYV